MSIQELIMATVIKIHVNNVYHKISSKPANEFLNILFHIDVRQIDEVFTYSYANSSHVSKLITNSAN